MEYFRMELYTPKFLTFCLISSNGNLVGRSDDLKVFRNSCDGVSVAHPYLRVFTDTFQQRVFVVELGQMSTSVFTCTCRFYVSAVCVSHELCAVADTQNRIFTADSAQVYLESLFIVNREGAS